MRNGREVRSYTTAFARAFSERLGNMVNGQLTATANLLADVWYTSWVDAGKPDLSELLEPVYTKVERKTLYREVKMFKRNELLENGKLISKKTQADVEE